MRKIKNYVTLFGVFLCLLIPLTGCSSLDHDEILTLVDGNIASIYLGKISNEYLSVVDDSEETIMQDYLDGLEVEAEYFANYWYIVDSEYGEQYSDLNDSLKESIIELFKDIYSHTKYSIESVSKIDRNTYAAKLSVHPINIMELAFEVMESETYEPLNAFHQKYSDDVLETMTDSEYWDYTNEYGELIVQLVREQLSDLDYKEPVSQMMQVEYNNDSWMINDTDFANFDSYVIYYP